MRFTRLSFRCKTLLRMPRKPKSLSRLQYLNDQYYKLGAPYFYMHQYRRGFEQLGKLYKIPIAYLQLTDMFQHYQRKHFHYASDASSNLSYPLTGSAMSASLASASYISRKYPSNTSFSRSESSIFGSLAMQTAEYCRFSGYFTQTNEQSTRLSDVAAYALQIKSVEFSDFAQRQLQIGDFIG